RSLPTEDRLSLASATELENRCERALGKDATASILASCVAAYVAASPPAAASANVVASLERLSNKLGPRHPEVVRFHVVGLPATPSVLRRPMAGDAEPAQLARRQREFGRPLAAPGLAPDSPRGLGSPRRWAREIVNEREGPGGTR